MNLPRKAGVASGLLGAFSMVLGTWLTAASYKGRAGESYSILNHFVSELGEVGVSVQAPLFNGSLVLGGLLLAASQVGLGWHLRGRVAFAAAVLGAIAGLACSAVGLLPMNDLPSHLSAAFTFFYCSLASLVLFTVLILRDRGRLVPRWLAIPGGLAVAAFASFLAWPFVAGLPDLRTLDPARFDRPEVWIFPILEWVLALSIGIWVVATALVLARHRDPAA